MIEQATRYDVPYNDQNAYNKALHVHVYEISPNDHHIVHADIYHSSNTYSCLHLPLNHHSMCLHTSCLTGMLSFLDHYTCRGKNSLYGHTIHTHTHVVVTYISKFVHLTMSMCVTKRAHMYHYIHFRWRT